jgi:riboflavin synthase
MFTGIVSAIGEIAKIDQGPVTRLAVRSPYDPAGLDIGASINHAGVCLTVVAKRADGAGMIHDVEMVPETLAKTSLGQLEAGAKINLERALKAGEELGGHLLSGHVDGVGRLTAITEEGGGSKRLTVAPPLAMMDYIAAKGSIAIDGVSLTVASIEPHAFSVAIIPHTALVTTLGTLKLGGMVNLEIDIIARYVARLLGRGG